MECIILAGGLGTRLQGVIGAYPKCMAPVCDRPFLYHLFQYLKQQQCSRVILSLGFKHEVIVDWIKAEPWPFVIDYVIEEEQLGTGGGIALAMEKTIEDDIIVINGDTMFRVDLSAMLSFHTRHKAAVTLALKHMTSFERYGVVNINQEKIITSFEEKKYRDEGLINGGIYVINKARFTDKDLAAKFSFEKDYLESFIHEQQFYGYESSSYFIDIGIPEDYQKAQGDFA